MFAEGVGMSGTILHHHDYDVFDLRKDFRHDASLLKFAAVYSRHETVGSGELFILACLLPINVKKQLAGQQTQLGEMASKS
jgi:hypothetical protein